MKRFSIPALIVLAGAMAVPAVAQTAAEPVVAENIEDVAERLKVPEEPCEYRRADGKCAIPIDGTRQFMPGATASPAAKVAKAFRANIQMSFLLGSAELTDQARAALDRFAARLVRVGKYFPFEVEGHTDRSGSPATNRVLSKARADSVVNYLASKGVDRSLVTARGYGYDRPLPGRSADDPANRRVEVVLR